MGRDDRGQRGDHRLDALAGRQQAECHQHLPPGKAEFGLELLAIRPKGRSGTPCGISTICSLLGAKTFREQLGGALAT